MTVTPVELAPLFERIGRTLVAAEFAHDPGDIEDANTAVRSDVALARLLLGQAQAETTDTLRDERDTARMEAQLWREGWDAASEVVEKVRALADAWDAEIDGSVSGEAFECCQRDIRALLPERTEEPTQETLDVALLGHRFDEDPS